MTRALAELAHHLRQSPGAPVPERLAADALDELDRLTAPAAARALRDAALREAAARVSGGAVTWGAAVALAGIVRRSPRLLDGRRAPANAVEHALVAAAAHARLPASPRGVWRALTSRMSVTTRDTECVES